MMINAYGSERLREAVRLNNEGVNLLQGGDLESARLSFRQALTLIQQVATGIDLAQNSRMSTVPILIQGTSALSESETSQSAFIYSRPLFLVYGGSLVLACVSVLTNMAICNHVHGIRTGYEASLVAAKGFYSVALRSLHTVSHTTTTTVVDATASQTAITALSILIHNNKGHIHYEGMEYDECRECFERLEYLMVVVFRNDRTRLFTHFTQEEVQGFTLNAEFLLPPTTSRVA